MEKARPAPRLKEVAAAAGVHLSTASLALRGDTRLPEATRARVRAAAEALGYRANPLISALNAARRRGAAATFQAGLAFVGYYRDKGRVGSSRVDLQACKLEYSIVSPK